MTLRVGPNTIGIFEIGACVGGFAIAALAFSGGLEANGSPGGTKDSFPAAIYFVFGSIAVFAATLDLRLILRRGIAGKHRIARHLWRMLFGLLMATASFFLGQMQVFPEPVRKIQILVLPVLIVIGLLVFWLFKVLRSRRYSTVSLPG